VCSPTEFHRYVCPEHADEEYTGIAFVVPPPEIVFLASLPLKGFPHTVIGLQDACALIIKLTDGIGYPVDAGLLKRMFQLSNVHWKHHGVASLMNLCPTTV
jgi:hypothetical protein